MTADIDKITRRRERLSIDYQYVTHTALRTHNGNTHWSLRLAPLCYETVRRQFLPHYFACPPRWRVCLRQLVKTRALPDFCVVGPGKSGTSDLAVTIMSHPNVLYPLVKECGHTDPLAWRPFYPTLTAVRRHAQRNGVALCPFVGTCLHSLDILFSLSALRPDTKIIIALRNPVDLIFSIWKWNVLHKDKGQVSRLPFLRRFTAFVDEAIELFHEAPGPLAAALHHGIYATSVAHWLNAFGEHNVRVLDVADYFKDRNGFLHCVEQFVGLPHVQLPPQLSVANQNPLAELTPDRDASDKLREFFAPYNLRLWEVIGTEYSW